MHIIRNLVYSFLPELSPFYNDSNSLLNAETILPFINVLFIVELDTVNVQIVG